MVINGYELIDGWQNSTCGKIATATKGGEKYFLKKYQTPVAPINNGTLDAKTFANNKKLFENFVTIRKTVNSRIRPIAGRGGNIIIPCEEFIDGNQLVEVSEFVKDAVPRGELVGILSSLSLETKKMIMKTAAGALSSIHGKHIVHSDLKLENLLLVRNSAGNYVVKMLDFDSSFPIDNKPEEIIGTIDYYSPELGRYVDAEDEEEEMKKYITEKTDIFSLGLIYHFYLSGEFPEAVSLTERLQKRKDKGKIIYPWIALNSGCELQLSPEIKSAKYISLISDMLSINPEDRPTALEVLKRLQSSEAEEERVIIEEPFPEHKISFIKDAIVSANVLKITKYISGSDKKYNVLYKGGKKRSLTKDEMLSNGYAKPIAPTGLTSPWPEHNIEYDAAKLASRGFVSSENVIHGGVKSYKLFRADGSESFFKLEMLLAMKYARKKDSAPCVVDKESTESCDVSTDCFAEPWPEHKITFDIEIIKKKGYTSSTTKTKNGIKGYEFIRRNGIPQFIVVDMLIIQKMAKRI